MPKQASLTDTQVRHAKPREKEYNLAAGDGLYLRVSPTGTKSWLFNYFKPYIKSRSNIAIGKYPSVSLAEAKQKRDEYRALLAKNLDPKATREAGDAEMLAALNNTFESVFRSWLETKKGLSEKYLTRMLSAMNLHVLPAIGTVPIADLSPSQTIEALRPLENKRNHETLRKVCGWINEIMDHAINREMVKVNRLSVIRKEFTTPSKTGRPAIPFDELPKFMRHLEQASITLETRCAIEWLMHTLVRPGEGVGARWDEFNKERTLWKIPASKMKMRRDHVVPLTPQARKILEVMEPLSRNSEFVFPSHIRPREHMNPETPNNALKRMGYKGKQVAHGFRALGSTALNEHGFESELIEVSLAHIDSTVRGDYNRAAYVERRRKIMAWWSQQIEKAAKGKQAQKN